MANFAKLDSNNIVLEVHAIHNDVINNAEGLEQESIGIDFLNNLYKTNDVWKQTSYSNSFRKQYAGIGYTYDDAKNKFIQPQPYTSWTLDGNDDWQAPITSPSVTNDGEDPVVWVWEKHWEESAYQADNTKGWKATKRNIDGSVHADTATYDWNGTAWVSS
jgi:hypothetical protein